MNKIKYEDKMNKVYWTVIFVLVVFAIASGLYFYNPEKIIVNEQELEGFAKCISEKGATMYGASWCSHCQNEKNNFGKSFKYVNYVECPDNIKVCVDKGIVGYPTWVFGDGSKIEGEIGLKKLSEKTGCDLASTTPEIK